MYFVIKSIYPIQQFYILPKVTLYIMKCLLHDGFTMMQYSVYIRHSCNDESAQVHVKRFKNHLPDDGGMLNHKITDTFWQDRSLLWIKTHTIRNITTLALEKLKMEWCFQCQIKWL